MLSAETIIFPQCGLSYGDLVTTVNKYRKRQIVAAKLGVSEQQLDRVIQRHNLSHLYNMRAGEVFIGVTASEILKAARRCANMREAALSLGLSPDPFYKKMKAIGATGYFNKQKPRNRCITKSQVISLAREGYTKPDTAFLLGISASYLKDLVALWNLANEFTLKGGQAAAVTRFGYAWAAGRKRIKADR